MSAPSAAAPEPVPEGYWDLRLYVAGQTPKSIIALQNLKRLCEEHLAGRYRIEVVDLLKNPQLARGDQILAIPGLKDDADKLKAAVFLRPSDSDGKGIAVGFNDNHTEWLPVDKAKAIIEKQTGKTLEQLIARQVNYDPDKDEE